MSELSEVFYSLLVTSCIGLILGLARMAYKSKCKEFKCGCLEIVRDVESEQKTDVIMINKQNSSTKEDEML